MQSNGSPVVPIVVVEADVEAVKVDVIVLVVDAPVLAAASEVKQLRGTSEKRKSLPTDGSLGPSTSTRTGKPDTFEKPKLAAWFSCTGPGASGLAGSGTSCAVDVRDTPWTPPEEVPA